MKKRDILTLLVSFTLLFSVTSCSKDTLETSNTDPSANELNSSDVNEVITSFEDAYLYIEYEKVDYDKIGNLIGTTEDGYFISISDSTEIEEFCKDMSLDSQKVKHYVLGGKKADKTYFYAYAIEFVDSASANEYYEQTVIDYNLDNYVDWFTQYDNYHTQVEKGDGYITAAVKTNGGGTQIYYDIRINDNIVTIIQFHMDAYNKYYVYDLKDFCIETGMKHPEEIL